MRITIKMLENIAQQINKVAGTPLTYCDKTGTPPFKTNIGHYYIDQAYGGNKLVQVVNDDGGIREVTYGFVTKRELYKQMQTFLNGMRIGRGD